MSGVRQPVRKDTSAPPAKDGNFRRRRLSVSGNELNDDVEKVAISSPESKGNRRQRRVSMSPEMGVIRPRALLPFPPEVVGTYSCHGVEPGIRVGETSAKINQDRGCVCFPFGPHVKGKPMALFCVFDGHGSQGDKVSHFTMNNIQQVLESHPMLLTNPVDALKETFLSVDESLKKDPSVDAELSGTTAVVCLCRFDVEALTATVWTACAGDSRAVLATKTASGQLGTFDLSEDQKPDTPAEMKRIKKKGGFVSPPEDEWGGPARVWLDASMTLPGLAMARSIGDHLVGNIGVIAEPEVTIKEVKLKGGIDQFIVLASDGVWEFIESQPAAEIVDAFIEKSATEACTRLIETSAAKWRQEEGDYRDDITAVCIRLRDLLDGYKDSE